MLTELETEAGMLLWLYRTSLTARLRKTGRVLRESRRKGERARRIARSNAALRLVEASDDVGDDELSPEIEAKVNELFEKSKRLTKG